MTPTGPAATPALLAALHARAMVQSPAWSEDAFARTLASCGAFLVAGPGGMALGRVAAGEAELLTLAVDPDRVRTGIGRGLLAGFEREARRRGALTAFLEVATDNAAALALYRSAGWQGCGLRRGYYFRPGAPPADALVLGKQFV